jgi:hypothetical protein
MHAVMGLNREVKLPFHAAGMLFFIIQTFYAQAVYCFENLLPYDPTVRGVSVDSTSQVHSSTMLVLSIVGN